MHSQRYLYRNMASNRKKRVGLTVSRLIAGLDDDADADSDSDGAEVNLQHISKSVSQSIHLGSLT